MAVHAERSITYAGTQFGKQRLPMMVSSSLGTALKESQCKLLASTSDEKSVCCALNQLLKDVLAFYVLSEKVHWHLSLHLSPATLTAGCASEVLAKELCHNTLQAISLVTQLRKIFDAESRSESAELITVVAQKITELSLTDN